MAVDIQANLFSQVMNDPELQEALEDWQEAKDDLEPIRAAFSIQNKRVKGLIAELEPGSYRCGRFTVSIAARPSRHVEFDVGDTRRVSIKLFDAEE